MKEFIGKNEFESLSEMIKVETKEIQAFIEAINMRDMYENLKNKASQRQKDLQIELQKVMAGKTTIKSLFTGKTKEEQIATLQQQIDSANKDIENLSLICDIVTVILGYIEIDRFKKEKEAHYYLVVKQIAKFEFELAKQQQEFWSYILENQNLN